MRLRDTPGVVDQTILATAQHDGTGVRVRIEQSLGIGGIHQAAAYRTMLAGYDYAPIKPTGEKASRWRPLAVQAEGGNVWLRPAPWVEPFVAELTALPRGRHDDQADAAAGAFNALAAPGDAGRAEWIAWQ